MKLQLKVIKADGVVEDYCHTKVLGVMNKVLVEIGEADIVVAEELADVVTYFLYHQYKRRSVPSSEILSMAKVALSGTGHEVAAVALAEHHYRRRLHRSRVEVVSVDINELADAEVLCEQKLSVQSSCWDKSRIVVDLVEGYGLNRQTARMVAGMVEEKVLGMGLTRVTGGLVKQLVLSDTAVVLRAERQLQAV